MHGIGSDKEKQGGLRIEGVGKLFYHKGYRLWLGEKGIE